MARKFVSEVRRRGCDCDGTIDAAPDVLRSSQPYEGYPHTKRQLSILSGTIVYTYKRENCHAVRRCLFV